MRVLLINPWIYDFAAYDLWSKPLGLLTIAAHLKRLGCEVRLIDCLDRFHPAFKNFGGKLPRGTAFGSGPYYSEAIDKPAIFKKIPREFKRYGLPKELFEEIIEDEPNPDLILVGSGMTYWYPSYIDAIGMLKSRFESVPVVLGGIYARLCPEHAKDFSGADFVYSGNGLKGILDIIFKLTGTGINRSYIADNERIFPAYDLYEELHYVTLRTSKGCPFKCSYCGWYLLDDNVERQESDFVISEIEHFYATRRIQNFAFYDDALLYDAENHIIKILNGILKRNIRVNFHTPNGLHNKFITPELARLLKLSGFVQPRLALETSSKKRQAETGAKTTNEDFLKAVKYLKDAGYAPRDIAVYIMIGLPGQSIAEIKESVEFAAAQNVRIFLEEYSPIPKTPDYEKSGLPADADPLLHNNSAFPLYNRGQYTKLQKLKTWVHDINKRSNELYPVGQV